MSKTKESAAISGMTGFGRAEGEAGAVRWIWEVKSVNGRGLELKLRTPPGFDALEPRLREQAARRFKRGSMQAGLQIKRDEGESALKLDGALLERLLGEGGRLHAQGLVEKPRWDGMLQVRGILVSEDADEDEDARAELERVLVAGLADALDALAEARRREGAMLADVLGALIDNIVALTQRAREVAGTAPEKALERLRQRLAAIAPEIAADPQRMAQEAALIAARADVAEELERLTAHAEEARALLTSNAPAGRRLDFLAQELTREANTLCSKSSDLELTRIGLDLKTAIDQIKEQAANVE